ncbi:MAG TPA: ribose-5-phosphate isomerase RpiA [Candidatus Binataceae bacterium]|nr:ribose-5-phosphate isomerase RpiA [Candidatus Binataceae bacterium]
MAASDDDLDALGEYALRYVKAGYKLGLGTGHAASAFIRALGKSGMKVRGVPTSSGSEKLARECGIEVVSLADVDRLDVAIDGADEVDPRLNLIKGYGGALVREKIVAESARKFVVVVGSEKIVKKLGQRGRLPVEVVPFAAPLCARMIKALGLKPKTRLNDDGSKFLSDNGNLIFDCELKPIANPARLDRELLSIPGVVGAGLFIAIADRVLIAEGGGKIRVLNRAKPG